MILGGYSGEVESEDRHRRAKLYVDTLHPIETARAQEDRRSETLIPYKRKLRVVSYFAEDPVQFRAFIKAGHPFDLVYISNKLAALLTPQEIEEYQTLFGGRVMLSESFKDAVNAVRPAIMNILRDAQDDDTAAKLKRSEVRNEEDDSTEAWEWRVNRDYLRDADTAWPVDSNPRVRNQYQREDSWIVPPRPAEEPEEETSRSEVRAQQENQKNETDELARLKGAYQLLIAANIDMMEATSELKDTKGSREGVLARYQEIKTALDGMQDLIAKIGAGASKWGESQKRQELTAKWQRTRELIEANRAIAANSTLTAAALRAVGLYRAILDNKYRRIGAIRRKRGATSWQTRDGRRKYAVSRGRYKKQRVDGLNVPIVHVNDRDYDTLWRAFAAVDHELDSEYENQRIAEDIIKELEGLEKVLKEKAGLPAVKEEWIKTLTRRAQSIRAVWIVEKDLTKRAILAAARQTELEDWGPALTMTTLAKSLLQIRHTEIISIIQSIELGRRHRMRWALENRNAYLLRQVDAMIRHRSNPKIFAQIGWPLVKILQQQGGEPDLKGIEALIQGALHARGRTPDESRQKAQAYLNQARQRIKASTLIHNFMEDYRNMVKENFLVQGLETQAAREQAFVLAYSLFMPRHNLERDSSAERWWWLKLYQAVFVPLEIKVRDEETKRTRRESNPAFEAFDILIQALEIDSLRAILKARSITSQEKAKPFLEFLGSLLPQDGTQDLLLSTLEPAVKANVLAALAEGYAISPDTLHAPRVLRGQLNSVRSEVRVFAETRSGKRGHTAILMKLGSTIELPLWKTQLKLVQVKESGRSVKLETTDPDNPVVYVDQGRGVMFHNNVFVEVVEFFKGSAVLTISNVEPLVNGGPARSFIHEGEQGAKFQFGKEITVTVKELALPPRKVRPENVVLVIESPSKTREVTVKEHDVMNIKLSEGNSLSIAVLLFRSAKSISGNTLAQRVVLGETQNYARSEVRTETAASEGKPEEDILALLNRIGPFSAETRKLKDSAIAKYNGSDVAGAQADVQGIINIVTGHPHNFTAESKFVQSLNKIRDLLAARAKRSEVRSVADETAGKINVHVEWGGEWFKKDSFAAEFGRFRQYGGRHWSYPELNYELGSSRFGTLIIRKGEKVIGFVVFREQEERTDPIPQALHIYKTGLHEAFFNKALDAAKRWLGGIRYKDVPVHAYVPRDFALDHEENPVRFFEQRMGFYRSGVKDNSYVVTRKQPRPQPSVEDPSVFPLQIKRIPRDQYQNRLTDEEASIVHDAIQLEHKVNPHFDPKSFDGNITYQMRQVFHNETIALYDRNANLAGFAVLHSGASPSGGHDESYMDYVVDVRVRPGENSRLVLLNLFSNIFFHNFNYGNYHFAVRGASAEDIGALAKLGVKVIDQSLIDNLEAVSSAANRRSGFGLRGLVLDMQHEVITGKKPIEVPQPSIDDYYLYGGAWTSITYEDNPGAVILDFNFHQNTQKKRGTAGLFLKLIGKLIETNRDQMGILLDPMFLEETWLFDSTLKALSNKPASQAVIKIKNDNGALHLVFQRQRSEVRELDSQAQLDSRLQARRPKTLRAPLATIRRFADNLAGGFYLAEDLAILAQFPGMFTLPEAVAAEDNSKIAWSRSVIGLAPNGHETLILDPQFALNEGGAAVIHPVFGKNVPAVLIARDKADRRALAAVNRDLKKRGLSPILPARDYAQARRILAQIAARSRILRNATPHALLSRDGAYTEAALLKQQYQDIPFTVILPAVLDRLAASHGVMAWVSQLRAQFERTSRSA